jgi:hypothetical protein
MKKATEMKTLSINNSKIIKILEEEIAPMMEANAKQGLRYFDISTDNFFLYVAGSRRSICEEICEYLIGFGYQVQTSSNNKSVYVTW